MSEIATASGESHATVLVRRIAALGVAFWTLDAFGSQLSGPELTEDVRNAVHRRSLAESSVRLTTELGIELLVLNELTQTIVIDLTRAPATSISSDVVANIVTTYQQDLRNAARADKMIDGFSRSLSQSYEEVNLIFLMSRELISTGEPRSVVENIVNELRGVLEFRWLAVLFNQNVDVVPALRGAMILSGSLPFAENVLLEGAASFGSLTSGQVITVAQNSMAAMAGSELLVQIVMQGEQRIGLIIAGSRQGSDSEIASGQIQIAGAAAQLIGLFHQNAHRFEMQRAQFMGTLRALTTSVDAKDSYTRGHSERVGQLAAQLAEKVGFTPTEVAAVRVAGLLHDIGKIGVPEAVLCKPARLTEEEFEQIKKHPAIGFNILKDIPSLEFHLPGVLHHHERWDGRGYPNQLSGEQIPLLARILAFADTFDAMSSNRAYRSALSRAQVLQEIRKSSGSQFDPGLIEPFVTLDFTIFDRMLQRFSDDKATLPEKVYVAAA